MQVRRKFRLRPPRGHFHFSSDAVQPGDLIFIDTFLPTYPGRFSPAGQRRDDHDMDSTSMT